MSVLTHRTSCGWAGGKLGGGAMKGQVAWHLEGQVADSKLLFKYNQILEYVNPTHIVILIEYITILHSRINFLFLLF